MSVGWRMKAGRGSAGIVKVKLSVYHSIYVPTLSEGPELWAPELHWVGDMGNMGLYVFLLGLNSGWG